MAEIVYKEESYKVVGACMEVYYLRATGMKLGILVNFGNSKKLEWERIILT